VIVRTFEGLQALTPPPLAWSNHGSPSLNLYGLNQAYAEIYRTQPNVRICVDFLARNIAQLAPQVFRRVSDTDRVRLVDHDLARWLGKPNPAKRQYRLFEDLVGDMGVYFNGYWMKVRYRLANGRDAIGIVRLPAAEMEAKGALLPTHFDWTSNGRVQPIALSEVVHFNGYNPTNALNGLSPLETLRRILAEEQAAGEHREGFWRNAARIEGVVSRPKEVKRYTQAQADTWREGVQAVYAGGAGAGKTLLLQEGETFTPTSWSAKDSEFILGGKLRREICAAAYHIPLPLVGILEHATFSNVKEQHKHLYQDCLGPWLEMIQQEIEGQLLVDCDDQQNVYVEFNINAKLAGTPEERAQSLQLSTGRPWRTVNEARALENLPRIDDPELDMVAPQQGGPAAAATPPADPVIEPTPAPKRTAADDTAAALAVTLVVQASQTRQQAHVRKLPIAARAAAFDLDRWNRELAADLAPLLGDYEAARVANELNTETLDRLEHDATRARIDALEQRPVAQQIDVHPPAAPLTVNLPAADKTSKSITLARDESGAVTGAEVVET
jgi:HK97 family phage portal protein